MVWWTQIAQTWGGDLQEVVSAIGGKMKKRKGDEEQRGKYAYERPGG